VLVSVSFLEVMCQILAVRCGAATLTGPPMTCLFLVAGKWVHICLFYYHTYIYIYGKYGKEITNTYHLIHRLRHCGV